jgi:hypothetical protein
MMQLKYEPGEFLRQMDMPSEYDRCPEDSSEFHHRKFARAWWFLTEKHDRSVGIKWQTAT